MERVHSGDVIRFSGRGMPPDPGIVILELAEEARPDTLLGLYEMALCHSELRPDFREDLERAFSVPGAMRFVAIREGANTPPIGFALAVRVRTPRELADALTVNHFEAHVIQTLRRQDSWAMLLSVDERSRRAGIGRVLANRMLEEIRARSIGVARIYVAVPARDPTLHVRMLSLGFSRDGVTRETHSRALMSRLTSFIF